MESGIVLKHGGFSREPAQFLTEETGEITKVKKSAKGQYLKRVVGQGDIWRYYMPIAKTKGININYKTTGQGEPLVMIMGLGSGQNGWGSQVPFFKKHFQVVTFDNRGVGKTDKPVGPYTIRMMADDTIALMDYLDIKKANILGASMGGMIAQEVAINYPERVARLVLACTFCCKDEAGGDTAEQAKLLNLSPHKMVAHMAKLAVNKPFYQFVIGNLAMIQTIFLSASARAGLEGQTEACNKHNTLDRLPLVKAPTLVIVGTKDRIIKPVSSELIARNIPGATLKKIEGGSHMFFMEMKSIFNKEVLDFLKKG
jgi:3-oxoadipate enol-lactonase